MNDSQAMQVEPSDVHQTLEYRADAEFASWLPIGLLTCFCGLFLFALAMPELPPPGETIGAAAAIPTGLGITVFALWRRFRRGRPVYVLAPEGIVIRVAFVKDIVIPWREIEAVDTIEITFRHWMAWRSRVLHYPDVTVVLVSREFYEAHVFINSLFLRGPYWHEGKFIQKGELVQCALHHEVVSAEPRALRAAVEARWQAFRDQPAAPTKARGTSAADSKFLPHLPQPRVGTSNRKAALEQYAASAPLLPKFVRERAAMYHELRSGALACRR